MTILAASFGFALLAIKYSTEMPVLIATFQLTKEILPWLWLTKTFKLIFQFSFLFTILGGIAVSWSTLLIFVLWCECVLNTLTLAANEIDVDELNRHLRTYRGLYVSLILVNEITRDYVLIALNNIIISVNVTCLTLYMGYHAQLDFETLITTALITLVTLIYLVLTYSKFGEINDSSMKLIRRIQRNVKTVKGNANDKRKNVLRLESKCMLPLRIDLGSFGYYKKPNSLRIIPKLMYYASKGIMISKKIF